LKEGLFRRDAVTRVKERPGFQPTRETLRYPDSRSRFNGIVF
jgi:hypothetical protein